MQKSGKIVGQEVPGCGLRAKSKYNFLKMAKARTWLNYAAWGSLSAEWVFKNLVFVFFIGFLGLVYIANAHFAEKKVRQIQALQKEVKELRWEYMSLKSDIMYNYKLSEVSKKVEMKGLRLKSPKKIEVEE